MNEHINSLVICPHCKKQINLVRLLAMKIKDLDEQNASLYMEVFAKQVGEMKKQFLEEEKERVDWFETRERYVGPDRIIDDKTGEIVYEGDEVYVKKAKEIEDKRRGQ